MKKTIEYIAPEIVCLEMNSEGVLCGSVISAVLGCALLSRTLPKEV